MTGIGIITNDMEKLTTKKKNMIMDGATGITNPGSTSKSITGCISIDICGGIVLQAISAKMDSITGMTDMPVIGKAATGYTVSITVTQMGTQDTIAARMIENPLFTKLH